MSQTVSSEFRISSTPGIIFLAFTRSMLLNQWLCDFSTVTPRPGGRMYLWWNGDFYSAGEYISLEENKAIKFKWHARFDPAPSEVSINLVPQDGVTVVRLLHTVPEGEEWLDRARKFKIEWDSTLPNLASLIETGLDLRIYNRPMLGIQISDFNADIAKAANIPTTEGLRLAEAIEGMGAHASGLKKDDVIVEFNGKKITNDFGSLALALQGKKGGDHVDVVFYRGQERHQVSMELTKRPVPDIPTDPRELARQVRTKYEQGFASLDQAFLGVSEANANYSPAPGEWSAKQTLAHLIHTERNWLSNIDDVVGGYERYADDWGGNIPAHIDATITAFGSIPAMISELRALSVEVINFLEYLPPEFVFWKCNYINLGNTMLNGMLAHTLSHIDQIKNAIASAKN